VGVEVVVNDEGQGDYGLEYVLVDSGFGVVEMGVLGVVGGDGYEI